MLKRVFRASCNIRTKLPVYSYVAETSSLVCVVARRRVVYLHAWPLSGRRGVEQFNHQSLPSSLCPETSSTSQSTEIKLHPQTNYQSVASHQHPSKDFIGPDATGTVKWFDSRKGFGFIIGPDKQDIFVHYSKILGEGFRILKDGSSVSYSAVRTSTGWRATTAMALDHENTQRGSRSPRVNRFNPPPPPPSHP